jgi:cation transport regulator ChaC
MEYVFGYGSLAWDRRGPVQQAELRGTRRVWGVAMDNTRDIPGYKHYRRRRDGSRPEVCVAFLDLEPAEGEAVNGICLAATPERLAALDRRERNYVRVDVTDRLEPRPPGRTWAYVGRPESRARLRRARARSRAVVSREYRDHVLRGFAALGRDALAGFRRSTELEGLPVVDLVRVDHRRPLRVPA